MVKEFDDGNADGDNESGNTQISEKLSLADLDRLSREDAAKKEALEDSSSVSEMETTETNEESIESEVQEVEAIPEEEVKKAKRNGHLSREDYIAKYGSDEGYKSEKEFNKFGEVYPEIRESLKGLYKKLEQRDKELEAVIKYNQSVKEREQKAARQQLVEALKQAQELGDVEAVRQLTKQETQMELQEAQEAAQQVSHEIADVTRRFQERNPWYNTDQEMTSRAMQLDQEIRQGRYAHIMPQPQNYEQLGNQIELLIKHEYGNRVNQATQVQQRQAPAISNTKSAIAKSGVVETDASRRFKTLSEDHKSIYRATKRMLEKLGNTYTEKEFIAKLERDGEI